MSVITVQPAQVMAFQNHFSETLQEKSHWCWDFRRTTRRRLRVAFLAMGGAVVTCLAIRSGAENEPTGVKTIQIVGDDREEPSEVYLRSRRESIDLNFRRLRPNQPPDLQFLLADARCLSVGVGVAGELDLVEDLHKLLVWADDAEIDEGGVRS